MKKLIKSTLLVFMVYSSMLTFLEAQEFCGTKDYKSPELIEFQLNGYQVAEMRADEMLHINVALHIVGTDKGTGYLNPEILFRQACEANAVYNKFGVNFYITSLDYIDNSRYYDHDYTWGGQMMRNHKVPGAVNIFFVKNPAGACGYYSPAGDAIAINNGCLGSGSLTWPHEVGHLFSLPHTFYGWEGREYDPAQPTPVSVNNTLTEKVDGSNCQQAGDGFCDTTPDYLSSRWSCNSDTLSPLTQKDVNKESFKSDGRNFMSYSADGCASRFSDQQISAIKYNILTTRKMNTSEPDIPLLEEVEMTNPSPFMDEEVYFDNVTFSWDPMEGALGYFLEYTARPSFDSYSTKVLVTEPFFKPDTIYPNWTNIQWRVKAYAKVNYCEADFGETHTFSTKITAVNNPALQADRSVYPNPVNSGDILHINSENGFNSDVLVKIYDATGTLMKQEFLKNHNGTKMSIQINELKSGMHFVHIVTREGKSNHKVMILQ